MAITRPKQRIPVSQKGKTWQDENLEYWSSVCSRGLEDDRASFLYRVAAGQLEPSDYMYVVNPLNTRRKELQGYPAKIRNLDIISPALMVLMGEKGKRYINSQVIAQNSDVESKRKDFESMEVLKMLQTDHRNALQVAGIDTGQPLDKEGNPEEQSKPLEQIEKEGQSIQDGLSTQGQNSLDYIMWYNKLPTEFREGFYDFLVTSAVCSYKRVWKDDVEMTIVPPHEIRYLHKSGLRFLEDAPAIKRLTRMNINEVFDRFSEVDGFAPIAKLLEDRVSQSTGLRKDYNSVTGLGHIARQKMWTNLFGPKSYHSAEDILVEHIVWTSQHKVGILTVPDITGELIEMEVSEDFIPTKYESVEWEWRPIKMEGYIIDGEHYLGVRPLAMTRAPAGKPNKCKNPYNGRLFNSRSVESKSIVEKGYVYQVKHNIMHYHAERIIAKNLDKIVVLPLSLVGDKHDEKSMMYYAQATGFLWVDPADSRNALNYLNAIKVIDASMGDYLSQISSFMKDNKDEWESSIGVNPQRKGNTATSQGKGTMEESIYRGSIMTEEIFLEYDEFQETELQGALDLSIFAFSEGKKAHYIKDDYTRAFLNINPEEYIHGDYLVHVSGSGVDKENLDMMKAQALQFAQNSLKPSNVGDVLQANNLTKLIKKLEKMEEELAQNQQAAAEAEQASVQAGRDHETQLMQMQVEQRERDSIRKAQVALAGAGSEENVETPEFGGFETPVADDTGTEVNTAAMVEDTKRQKIAADERSNVRDNKTKLANPVVGERKK